MTTDRNRAIGAAPGSSVVGGRHPGWPAFLGPVRLPTGAVRLRPLLRRDGRAWQEIRIRDERVISPWDATSPVSWADRHNRAMWLTHRSVLARSARRGEVLPFAVTVDGRFAGQVTVGGIQRGALSAGWVGYWIDSSLGGQGIGTSAVAMAVGHALGQAGLHRIEATISPDNQASLRVVGHLGFRQEGYLVRYLDVGGKWRDHLLFAMTAEEVTGGVDELLARHRSERPPAG